MNYLRLSSLALAAVLCGPATFAQSVISAHSGLVHYYEGEVTLDGKQLQTKFGEFPDVKPGHVISTQLGRMEMLLTEGITLRLGENGALRMISAKLEDTQLELLSGSALFEVAEPIKLNHVTILFHGYQLPIESNGLYRVDSDPASVRCYAGQLVVHQGVQSFTLKSGRMLDLGTLVVEKFDPNKGDSLYRWAKRRSQELAVANISAARSIRNSSSFFSTSMWNGGWSYNPYMGLFTYVPSSGMWTSPFGWNYWSPSGVSQVYSNYYNSAYAASVRPGRGPSSSNSATSSSWSSSDASRSQSFYSSSRAASSYSSPSSFSSSATSSVSSSASSVSSPRGGDSGGSVSSGGAHSGGGGGGRGGH